MGPQDAHVATVAAQCRPRICLHHGDDIQELADQGQVVLAVVQFASESSLALGDADKPLRPVSSSDKGLRTREASDPLYL